MKTRYCMQCGRQIPTNSVFCPFCGATQKSMDRRPVYRTRVQRDVQPQPDVSSGPSQLSTTHHSYLAVIVSLVDLGVDILALFNLYRNYSRAVNYRPYNDHMQGHPVIDFFVNKADSGIQADHAEKLLPQIAGRFLPIIIIMVVVTAILLFALRKKQSKVINFCLVGAVSVMIVVIFLLFSWQN